MKGMLSAAGLVLLLAGAAGADEAYDACMETSPTNDAAWADCASAWVVREDDRLNATWQRVYGRTSGQTSEDLLAEQRAWIGYRETVCRFYFNGDWGSAGRALDGPACIARVIAARTAELEAYDEFFWPK